MSLKRSLIFVLFLCLFFHAALAEEEPSSHSMDLLGKALNFLILFGGLAFVLYKPLRNFLSARAQKIESTLRETKNSWEEAEDKLAQVKERLKNLEEEITEIKKNGEVEGQKQRQRIMEEAHQEAERLRRFAQEEIEMLTRAGIRELKEHAAELTTRLAEEKIRRRITPEMASGLIDKSIQKIESLYEESNSGKKIHPRIS
jgi:F-type H+-transporting ATPase subunit b